MAKRTISSSSRQRGVGNAIRAENMSGLRKLSGLGCAALVLSLGACATAPPSGPSFVALPGDGKTYSQFSNEDGYCRQLAFSRSGYSRGTGANSTTTGAVLGTVLGAGAGALLGAAAGNAGIGAAAGAGTGLLGGSLVGADNGALDEVAVQRNYDATYAQCMASYGNKVPPPGQIASVAVSSYDYGYGYPAYATYGYGPGLGWGWGWGGYGWGGYGGGPFYSGIGYYGGGYYRHGYYGHGYYGHHGYGGRGYYGHGGYRGGGGFHGGYHR